MKFKLQTKTQQVLTVLKILAWVAFFGFMVRTGAYLISYVISCFNPEGAGNLYQGLSLLELRQYNFAYYSIMVAILIIMSSLKAIVWWMVVKVISKIQLSNPFSLDIAHRLEYISYSLFATWIFALLGSAYAGWLIKYTSQIHEDWNSGEFLFMTGLIFIVSQIFKRGVELQSENELTV